MMTHATAPAANDRQAFRSDTARWKAVLARDPAADGAFWFAVRSTGVYCRPSCPARRPLRENVEFHPSTDSAERAGFRPCRRCNPRDISLPQRRVAAVTAACAQLDAAVDAPDLDAIAAAAGMSRFHFQRIFKQITGLSPGAYARANHATRIRAALATQRSVTKSIYDAGFKSSGHFYTRASALGMTPSQFQAQGKGVTLCVAFGNCSLGEVLVAASDRGICAIFLGSSRQDLLQQLQREFPAASIQEGTDKRLQQQLLAVIASIETPGHAPQLPLDLRGTLFQRRVWRALQGIPCGQTVTYSSLARKLGIPRAARAVAAACAANRIAVAVPCHRVIRTDGSLAGYRWGVDRKRDLLAREAATGKCE